MLSAAKHLSAQRDRPFAALRVTLCHCVTVQTVKDSSSPLNLALTGLNATVYLRLMLFPVPVRGMRQTRFHEE